MSGRGSKPSDTKSTLYCSFCGKSQHEVKKLIAGPTSFICDECIILCEDIIWDEDSARVRIQIRLPTGIDFDDALNDALARVIDERLPNLDFKYEFRTQHAGDNPNKSGHSIAMYSFESGGRDKDDIKNYLRTYLLH